MTVPRDAEMRQRHRCTSWIKLNGVVIQCDSGFATAEGHAGPHYHFDKDESPKGGTVRLTW